MFPKARQSRFYLPPLAICCDCTLHKLWCSVSEVTSSSTLKILKENDGKISIN